MKKDKLVVLFRFAVYFCGFAAGILQLLSALTAFEAGTHYFVRGSALPVCAWVVSLLGVGFAIASAFLDKEQPVLKRSRFSPLFAAVGFAALLPALFALLDSETKTTARLALLALLLVILAGNFCLLSAFAKKQFAGLTAILGLLAVLAPACLALIYYFDKSVEMNAPVKVCLQTGLLFSMFPFLCDVRTRLNRPIPRLLTGLRLACFPIASLSSCLLLPLLFSGRFARIDYLFGGVFLFALQLALLFDLFPSDKDHI